jgi:hypothetical protein
MIAGLLNNSPVVICTVSPLIFLATSLVLTSIANLIHNGSRVIVADIIERVEKTEQDKLEDAGQQRLGI